MADKGIIFKGTRRVFQAVLVVGCLLLVVQVNAGGLPNGVLPGELSAEELLNGKYPWPPSPEVVLTHVDSNAGFMPGAFGQAPEPGIHPRILFSPEDIPEIRKRIQNTTLGVKAYANLKKQIELNHTEGTCFANMYAVLKSGDVEKAADYLDRYREVGSPDKVYWHHRSTLFYGLVVESFAALIDGNAEKGRELAGVIATLGGACQMNLDRYYKNAKEGTLEPGDMRVFYTDVWRGEMRWIIHSPWYGLAYDLAYNWMTADQQAVCRNVINDYIRGKITMGANMPHHFRNWNWIAVGSSLLTMSLATEGEEGNDARVYELQKEIQTDYIKYGWSQKGASREAVGYTQFGLTWGNLAMVAMARRGHDLFQTQNWYNSFKWYAQSAQVEPGRFLSHGDGANTGPSLTNVIMMKRAYPNNPLIDYVCQLVVKGIERSGTAEAGSARGEFSFDLCLFVSDPSDADHQAGATLDLELTHWDPERNQLITRNEFSADRVQFQMECRPDAYSANHMHADRGVFLLGGAGRTWAVEHFRGAQTRHHSLVTIDYKGMAGGPGIWLGLFDSELSTFGVCDSKRNYDLRQDCILSGYADRDQPRRQYKRWEGYTQSADEYLAEHPDFKWEEHIDRTPQVAKYWDGFEKHDPRMWDEFSRPVLVPFNPVQKAFRTGGLVRGKYPYVLVVDDIRKDDSVHTYHWNMMVDHDVKLMSAETDRIVLGTSSETVDHWFSLKKPVPHEGDSQLLIHILERAIPDDEHNPQIRLETLEYKDGWNWPTGRSYGLTKRLVIPSFSAEPKFKMLMFPHRHGQSTPEVIWYAERTAVTIAWDGQVDVIAFREGEDGRTRFSISLDGKVIANVK